MADHLTQESPPEMLTWRLTAEFWQARCTALADERDRLSRALTIQRVHDALATDRGCEHPKAMRPQCERVLAALIKEDVR